MSPPSGAPASIPNVDRRPDGPELSIDVRAFLPEGTEVGDGTESDRADGDDTEGDLDPAPVGGEDASEPGADGATVDLAVLTRIEGDLAAVDAALAALDEGTYGRCTTCGTEIEAETLAAEPITLTCPAHRS